MRERIEDAIGDLLSTLAVFLPKALLFLLILLVGFIVAKVLANVVDSLLERIRFNRAVERTGIGSFLPRSNMTAGGILAKIVYYIVVLFTLQLAFGLWGDNPVSDLLTAIIAWLPKFFVAALIVFVAAAIARGAKDFISSTLGGLSYGNVLANVAAIFILGLGIIAALAQIGIAVVVTLPLLYFILVTISGILIVGVGGGLIYPMRARLDGWLNRAVEETRVVVEEVRSNAEVTSPVVSQEPVYRDDDDSTDNIPPVV